MSEVIINLSEKELRNLYLEHVKINATFVPIATILQDEQFVKNVKQDHLGGGGRNQDIPVKITVK